MVVYEPLGNIVSHEPQAFTFTCTHRGSTEAVKPCVSRLGAESSYLFGITVDRKGVNDTDVCRQHKLQLEC